MFKKSTINKLSHAHFSDIIVVVPASSYLPSDIQKSPKIGRLDLSLSFDVIGPHTPILGIVDKRSDGSIPYGIYVDGVRTQGAEIDDILNNRFIFAKIKIIGINRAESPVDQLIRIAYDDYDLGLLCMRKVALAAMPANFVADLLAKGWTQDSLTKAKDEMDLFKASQAVAETYTTMKTRFQAGLEYLREKDKLAQMSRKAYTIAQLDGALAATLSGASLRGHLMSMDFDALLNHGNVALEVGKFAVSRVITQQVVKKTYGPALSAAGVLEGTAMATGIGGAIYVVASTIITAIIDELVDGESESDAPEVVPPPPIIYEQKNLIDAIADARDLDED